MPLHQLVRFYADDDTTLIAEAGTDPSHANPYLFPIEQRGSSSVNFVEGAGSIGQITVQVLDKRRVATNQQSGWFTFLLPNATGYNRIIGRRIVALQQLVDGGPFVPFFDGLAGDTVKEVGERMVVYRIPCRSIRERERITPIFTKLKGRTILPWAGVLSGYGTTPADTQAVPPATWELATFTTNMFPNSPTPVKGFVLQKQLGALGVDEDAHAWLQNVAGRNWLYSVLQHGGAFVVPVLVQWQSTGGGAWNTVPLFPTPDAQNVHTIFSFDFTSYRADAPFRVWANSAASGLPANLQTVRLRVLPLNVAPSETLPLLYERNFGELLEELYRGEHSDIDPALLAGRPLVHYDQPAMDSMKAATGMARIRLDAPVEDMMKWVQEHIYKVTGYAPVVDPASGAVVPTRYELPDADAALFGITDAIARDDARWSQSAAGAVNAVEFIYTREWIEPHASGTPENQKTPPLARLRSEPVRFVRNNIASQATGIGVKPVKFEPVTVRTVMPEGVQVDSAQYRTLDAAAVALRDRRVAELAHRFLYGDQRVNAALRRSAAGVNDLKPGAWCQVQLSWLPDLATGLLGMSRLMQVVHIEETDHLWRTVELSDAGPFDVPAQPITLGALSFTNGQLQVPVTNVPAGVTGRVEYAVGPVEPAQDSGEWAFLASVTAASTVVGPQFTDAERVWVRGRGEIPGRRRSLWQVVFADAPTLSAVHTFVLDVDDSGAVRAYWFGSASADGVRIHFDVHAIGTEWAGTFSDALDVDTSAGTAATLHSALITTLQRGEAIAVQLEPFPDYPPAGGAGERTNVGFADFPTLAAGGGVVDTKPSIPLITATIDEDGWLAATAVGVKNTQSFKFAALDGGPCPDFAYVNTAGAVNGDRYTWTSYAVPIAPDHEVCIGVIAFSGLGGTGETAFNTLKVKRIRRVLRFGPERFVPARNPNDAGTSYDRAPESWFQYATESGTPGMSTEVPYRVVGSAPGTWRDYRAAREADITGDVPDGAFFRALTVTGQVDQTDGFMLPFPGVYLSLRSKPLTGVGPETEHAGVARNTTHGAGIGDATLVLPAPVEKLPGRSYYLRARLSYTYEGDEFSPDPPHANYKDIRFHAAAVEFVTTQVGERDAQVNQTLVEGDVYHGDVTINGIALEEHGEWLLVPD